MRVFHWLERDADRPLSLAIGFFDGMHLGHQDIARSARRLRRPGWRCGVLTFADHPAAFLRPERQPALIDTQEERVERLAQAGFEECFLIPFDERIARLSPQAFLQMLVDRLKVRAIVVGATFRFGHLRTGDVDTMRAYLSTRDVELVPIENAYADEERISSTRVRGLIADGDLTGADRLLGGTGYGIHGTVELGAGRGHGLGFPTANVRPPDKLLPKDGVYAATARFDGRDYPALVSIGTNPQFGGTRRTIEAWLRDFHQTIYGRELALREFRYLREQMLFDNAGQLMHQMQRDLEAVAYPKYA